jgi:hypothetical protein
MPCVHPALWAFELSTPTISVADAVTAHHDRWSK